MTCIKTGADVFLPTHGATIHGDLFEIGDVYILAHGDPGLKVSLNFNPDRAHISTGDFKLCGSYAIAFEKAWAGPFNYDGFSLLPVADSRSLP